MSEAHGSLLDRLADAVAGFHPDRRIRVAIDGVDGAGKTTLANALAPLVAAKGRPVIRASVDDFHNPQSVRYARGRYSPHGFYLNSYDYNSFRRLLLQPLSPGGSGQYAAKRFDLDNDQAVRSRSATAPRRRRRSSSTAFSCIVRSCDPAGTFRYFSRSISTSRCHAAPHAARASMRSIPTRRRISAMSAVRGDILPNAPLSNRLTS